MDLATEDVSGSRALGPTTLERLTLITEPSTFIRPTDGSIPPDNVNMETSPDTHQRTSQNTPAEDKTNPLEHDAAQSSVLSSSGNSTREDLGRKVHSKKPPEDNLKWVEKPPREGQCGTSDGVYVDDFKNETSDYLSSSELYETYLQRLQKVAKEGGGIKDKDKTQVLVRSLLDSLSSYDERMRQLEEKIGLVSKDKAKVADSPDVAGVKFYDVDDFGDGEIGASNEEEDEWNVAGAFCSAIEAHHRIRVLFRWKSRPDSKTKVRPDPHLIEVLEIRVKSKPIAVFFEKELDYNISQDDLIHFVRPFRFLVRKIDHIRDHVKSSKERHRPSQDIRDTAVIDAPENHRQTSSTSRVDPFSPEFLESEESLLQFEELLRFVDSYLVADLSLFREYKNGERSSVVFDNLWMLFDTQEAIYCPTKKGDRKIHDEQDDSGDFMETLHIDVPQVYCVLATLGGIARDTTTPVDSASRKGQKKRFQTLAANSPEHIRGKHISLFVDCYCIRFDGVRFRPVADKFEFKPFNGHIPVTSLEAYPLKYHTNLSAKAMESFIERGGSYVDLTSVQHVSHNGFTVGERKEEINSPVIVDFKSAYQHNDDWKPELKPKHIIKWLYPQKSVLEIPKRTCSHKSCHKTSCLEDVAIAQQKSCLEKEFRDIDIVLDNHIVDSNAQIERIKEDLRSRGLLQLLPGTAYAFALRSRKWVQVDLRNLGTVKQEDNWADLVLPPGHKDMVQAMVVIHTASGATVGVATARTTIRLTLFREKVGSLYFETSYPYFCFANLPKIRKGCIILLHGEPGVGKTSTAECVAAYTKRPLYPITCGDLGILPTEVEAALDKHFTQAHKWGCVLLLDEADVFLAKRNKNGEDIKRNGLVSVFLRTLEYYSGILFLTTNRVGSFDDAFRSRIHVQLHYPKLSRPFAVKIWENNISRLERHNKDRRARSIPEIKIDSRKILKFAKASYETLQWNGRQIRNAFQTAIAIAEFEARNQDGELEPRYPEVTRSHFRKVAAATTEFDDYLQQIFQMDQDKIAYRDKDRVTYTPKTSKVAPEESCSSDSTDSSDESSDDDSDDSESPAEAKSKRSKKKKQKEKKEDRKKDKSKKSKS